LSVPCWLPSAGESVLRKSTRWLARHTAITCRRRYGCTYVCMHARMYTCVYVCMWKDYGFLNAGTQVSIRSKIWLWAYGFNSM
jgi:hypothetical protein